MEAAVKRQKRDTGTTKIGVTLPTELLEKIDALADLEESNRSYLIAELLEKALKEG